MKNMSWERMLGKVKHALPKRGDPYLTRHSRNHTGRRTQRRDAEIAEISAEKTKNRVRGRYLRSGLRSEPRPHAGDFNRGTGSIAVDFRDWIEPWYTLEYTANTGSLLTAYRDRLTPKFTANLNESVGLVKGEVAAITAGGGLLKQRRDYDVIHQALDQVNIAAPPTFLNAVTQAVQSAIKMEQTMGGASGATANQGVAFEVFTQAATKGDASLAAVNDAVSAVQKQVAQVQQSFTDVNKQVSTMQSGLSAHGARLDAALADGGIIHNLQADVSAVRGQVGTLQVLNLNPTEIRSKLDLVASLDNRLGVLEVRR
jgi:hypothetical protein